MNSKNYFVLLLILSLTPILITAQAPNVSWIKTYGAPNVNDYGKGAYQTSDGGYIVGGFTTRDGQGDRFIIKLNAQGDSLWEVIRGVSDNENVNSFRLMRDGRLLTGGSIVRGLNVDVHVMFLAPDGSHQYSGYIGHEDLSEVCFDAVQDLDSGFVFAASVDNDSTGLDIMLCKLATLGAPVWQFVHEEADRQIPYSIAATMDGGYIVVGEDQHHGTTRAQGFIMKINNSGAIDRLSSIDSGGRVVFKSVKQLPDKGYIIVGLISYDIHNTNYDMYVTRRDSNLAEVWTKTFGKDDENESGVCVDIIPDDGFIIGGSAEATNGRSDFWALRLDNDGEIIWSKLSGTINNDAPNSISRTDDGGFIMCGNTDEVHGTYKTDMLVIKLNPELVDVSNEKILPEETKLYANYPNPFNPVTTISYSLAKTSFANLTVYDVLGNKVKTLVNSTQSRGEHKVYFDGSGLASGVYYCKLSAYSFSQIRKMLLLK